MGTFTTDGLVAKMMFALAHFEYVVLGAREAHRVIGNVNFPFMEVCIIS